MKCFIFIVVICTTIVVSWSWGSEKVLLRDVSALTLHKGWMTTGRRSSPVPQLKCIGGSAGCNKFLPETVQCRNVGFDGHEVQWECKCDMDDSYRFGKVQVNCEGYEYPEDPYILKGSCGLEYTLDYTEAGKSRSYQNYNYSPAWKKSEFDGSWIFFFVIVAVVVFMICKMGGTGGSETHHHQPDYRGRHSPSGHNNPPPYGFKPEYTQSSAPPPPSYADATSDPHYSSTRTRQDYGYSTTTNTGTSQQGFWTGLGLGGLGGYLFGRQRRSPYGYSGWGNGGWNTWGGSSYGSGWGRPSYGSGWGSSWGGGSTTTYRRSGGSSSSGTSRTASGFGGTSRR